MSQRYERKRRDGICYWCSCSAVPGYRFCAKCLLRHKEGQRKWNSENKGKRMGYWSNLRKRRRDMGECVRCGAPLVEGEKGYCIACKIERRCKRPVPVKKGVFCEVTN